MNRPVSPNPCTMMRSVILMCFLLCSTLGVSWAQTLAPEDSCLVDLCVAIDRSVSSAEWTHALEHVASFVTYLSIDATTIRVGLVSYDAFSTLDIPLDKHSDALSLQQDIRSQVYGGSGRDLSGALFRMRVNCFEASKGDRPEVENIAVLITSGSSDAAASHYEANLLRQEASILSIGVGGSVDYNQLVNISGDPSRVFSLATYQQLEMTPTLYLHKICANLGGFPPISSAPTVSVSMDAGSSDFQFDCTIHYPVVTGQPLYQVMFLYDGVDSGHPLANLTPPATVTSMPGSLLSGHMGKLVSCVVQSFWLDEPNSTYSPPTFSIPYYAGLVTSPSELTISESSQAEGGEPVIGEVIVRSTIPILCPDGADPCQLIVNIVAPSAVVIEQHTNVQACSFVLSATDWAEPSVLSVSNQQDVGQKLHVQPKEYVVTSPLSRSIPVSMEMQMAPSIWTGYQPQDFTVNILGGSGQLSCSATYDPNILTFDGASYGLWEPGIFRLTDIDHNNFHVQIVNDASTPEYICAIAIKSGTTCYPQYPDIIGETIILDRCNRDTIDILRCHPEDHGLIELKPDGVTYVIKQKDKGKYSTTVEVTDKGNRLNVEIITRKKNAGLTSGLCGDSDDDMNDDIPTESMLAEFRIDNIEDSFFSCEHQEEIFFPEIYGDFCQCEDDPVCVLGDTITGEYDVTTSIIASMPTRGVRDDAPQYTDDVIYDYQPPTPYTGPILNPQRPPWGTYGISEAQARTACEQGVFGSSSYAVCQDYMSPRDMDVYTAQCMSDIQVTGELFWAQEHVLGFQGTCESNIRMTINVTDPDDPGSDPVYKEVMDGFLNTTCGGNCSVHGHCDRGVCYCDTGYMGIDCTMDVNTPPAPIRMTGPDTCDVSTQPCVSVKVVARDLVRSNQLTCRVHLSKTDGSSVNISTAGELSNPETIKCGLLDLHDLGNSSLPASYNYSVSISNNDVIFADVATENTRVVWHSDWMWWQCLAEGKMYAKTNSCSIENVCRLSGEMRDACYGCHPEKDPLDWTPKQEILEDTNLSPWSAYSPCSKDCDYGLSVRTRNCTDDCCGFGPLQASELCNTNNCAELEEELLEGVIITIAGVTMIQVVEHEEELLEIVTDLLNTHNAQHPSDFCAALDMESAGEPTGADSALTQNDTFTAQGYPSQASTSIDIKLITMLHASEVAGVCGDPGTLQTADTGEEARTLDSAYMIQALQGLQDVLKQEWGQDVEVTLTDPDPADVSGVNLTLILAIVVPLAVVVLIIAIAVPLTLKKKKNSPLVECMDDGQTGDNKVPDKEKTAMRRFSNSIAPVEGPDDHHNINNMA